MMQHASRFDIFNNVPEKFRKEVQRGIEEKLRYEPVFVRMEYQLLRIW